MIYEEMLEMQPYGIVRLGNRHNFHIIKIFISDSISWHVIADRDWSNYTKHYTIDKNDKSYRTVAEVEGVSDPEIKEWKFTFAGTQGASIEDIQGTLQHMGLLKVVSK